MDQNRAVLEMKNISKSFPGVRALDNVNLALSRGEILTILGENGAGKSTLLKILAGVYEKDEGAIYIDGVEKRFQTPMDAIKEGISVIYQELSYVNDLTVAENIFINRYPEKMKGIVDWGKLNQAAAAILDSMDINIKPKAMMKELSVAEKQMVEIARAVSQDMKILITDEPTSAITDHEVEFLFSLFRKLKNQGVSIIFISHKLEEVMEISDYIMVLRDGKNQGLYDSKEIKANELISHMIGRSLDDLYPDRTHISGDVIVELKEVTTDFLTKPVNFTLHKGEIIGVYGLMGSGISEIGEILFGIKKIEKGEIRFKGEVLEHIGPEDCIRKKIAYVPAERKKNGMIGGMSIMENIALPDLVLKPKLFLDHESDKKRAKRWKDHFAIKAPNIHARMINLSGGNQQKAILSKWLDGKPELLILHEPTRGVDMGAKAEIYKFIEDFCQSGGAVVLISSELPEICALADVYLILHDGEVQQKVFSCTEIDDQSLMAMAMGLE